MYHAIQDPLLILESDYALSKPVALKTQISQQAKQQRLTMQLQLNKLQMPINSKSNSGTTRLEEGNKTDLSPTLSAPTSSTTAWITSKAKRHLFSTLPPYSSVLWFGLGLMNWSIK